jgi:hypothetical protein
MITINKEVNVVSKLSLIASWTISDENELTKLETGSYKKSATMGKVRYVMTTPKTKNTISFVAAFLSLVDWLF